MSNPSDDKKKRCIDDEDEQREKKKANVEVENPEDGAMKADLLEYLEATLEFSKLFLDCKQFADNHGLSIGKGTVLHGKPDLGIRVKEFLQRHGKDVVRVLPRDLVYLTASKCEDTFKRAFCCAPSIILFIGLERAATDVAAMIKEKIKENADSCAHVFVIGTTAIYGQVSEKLTKCFSVIDLQELADSVSEDKTKV